MPPAPQDPAHAPPLARATKLWYGLGQAAEGLKNEAFSVLLLFYYTQVLGLSGALAGQAILLALLVDAVSDPLAGALSDRLQTRWGRRHPFLYASAVPLPICFYLTFAAPAGLSQTQLFAWLATTAISTRLSMTLFHVPHMALGAELSADYQERTTIATLQYVFARIGHGVTGVLAFLVYFRSTPEHPTGQLNPEAYPSLALVLSLAMSTLILLSALRTHSRIPYLANATFGGTRGGVFGDLIRDLRLNLASRSFRALFFGNTLTFIAFGIATALGLYMATYFWKVTTEQLLVWGVATAVGVFGGLDFWHRMAARHEKKPIFIGGLGVFTVFLVAPPLLKVAGAWPAHDSVLYLPAWMLTTGFLAHFGITSTMVTGRSMMADVGDQFALIHGRRSEGVLFGAIAFAAKASFGAGSLVAGLVVSAVGLEPGAEPDEVAASVVRGLGLAQGLLTLAFCGLSFALFSRYDIDAARHADTRARLAGAPQAGA